MSEFPEGWFRGTSGSGGDAAGSSEPTTQLPVGGPPPGSRPGSGRPGSDRPGSGQPSSGSAWPEQPPASSSGRGQRAYSEPRQPRQYPGGPPGSRSPRTGGGRSWLRPRRIFAVLAVLVALVLVAVVGEYFNLNSKLTRANVLVSYAGQPAQGAGTNWLIAGSDGRQGLSGSELKKLSAGQGITGHRSDTVMILHVPSSGKPILISIPRDSWVNIPGYGFSKINAAYDFGGPELLAKTVQNATGLRIDHYMEIGFGGFVKVVNSIGGVRMCIPHALFDRASGLHLHKGCHTLGGDQALAFVRDRHSFAALQDLQRVQDQRLFLKALLGKLTSAGVLLNPFAIIPAASGAAGTLTVDSGTSLYQLAEVAFALSHPETTTVPIANSSFFVDGQDAVQWNTQAAHELFTDLNQGNPVPRSLISGSHLAS
jgi:LCP family protein required for cell wall assembly